MRIDDLLAQNKSLARIAELEAKLGQPPKTPDNSSLPLSRAGRRRTPRRRRPAPPRKGRPGVARQLAENPDATRRFSVAR